jgi:hypothetical protein
MFRKRKNKSRAHDMPQVQRRYERDESSGKDIEARLGELRRLPRGELADAVFMLSMAAKQHCGQIRRAIKARARSEFDFDPPPSADLATYLAEDAVAALRHHMVDVPRLVDLLPERRPDVRFTVDQRDAVSMLAALIREQRLEGILEGLRLAGLLNESSKERHAGFGS